MPEAMAKRAERAIEEKVFPGCVIGLIRTNGTRMVMPCGDLIYQISAPVAENTVYDIASITKSIPTASLAAMLMAEGKLTPADNIREYLPELKNDYDATIEDLLTYRVRGPQLSKLPFTTFEEIRTHVFERGFDGPPGERAYTNLPAFLLGIILEQISESSLAELAHKRLFEPFKMTQTTFFPSASDCAPTEIRECNREIPNSTSRYLGEKLSIGMETGQEIRGIVHDKSARIFSRARRAVGHAGLFSTAGDLLNFLEALLRGDLPDVVLAAEKGWGWQVNAVFMGSHASAKTFGKTGFTGTSVVCDVGQGVAFVLLSNRTYPKRPPDDSAIQSFRSDIADIILGS